jgi:hypothetical protein
MLIQTILRTAMAIAGIVLVYRFAAEARDGRRSRGGWPELLLLNLALIAVVLHFGIALHPRTWVRVHHHDIFHYYMGSKYSAEIGYNDLYYAAAVADADTRGPAAAPPLIRRMDDYTFVSGRDVVARGDHYRRLFTDERWKEFQSDVVVFRTGVREEEHWKAMFRDNGYNATPVWNMVARAITDTIPVTWGPGVLVLVSLDAILLLLTFTAIARAFGFRTSLLAVVFLGSLVFMAHGTIRGAFLRLDWLAFLVIATCALKRDRYKTAGALVAFAGMVRIFPLVFAFGLGAKLVWDLLASRRVNRRHVEFLVTLAIVAILLVALSLATGGGLESWETFWTKIQFHDTHMSPLRVGFKTLLLAGVAPFMEDWPGSAMARSARFGELTGLWWALQALVLLVAFFAVRRLCDYETLPFCYVLAYFLFAPTFYYQVVLLLLTLLYLPKLDQRPRAHAMALLFGISVVGYALIGLQNLEPGLTALEWKRVDYGISLSLAAMLLVAALVTMGLSLSLARRDANP